jgi:DNA-binding transcriptional MocR family regulator
LELAKLLRGNPDTTNKELAQALNVSRNTITEDRKSLMAQVNQEAKTQTQLHREDQLARIEMKWQEIDSDASMTGAEKHLAWSRWMKLEMDLRGTAAPTKSISANLNVNPEHSKDYLDYREAFAGLYDDERQEELARVKARPRTSRPPVMDASWFPTKEPKLLKDETECA